MKDLIGSCNSLSKVFKDVEVTNTPFKLSKEGTEKIEYFALTKMALFAELNKFIINDLD